MKKLFTAALFLLALAYIISCENDNATDINLDTPLEEVLNQKSVTGSLTGYIMPESTEYAKLPNQDPKNPVTAEKVELGRLLFFETGLGLENKYPASKSAYSCSSCHIPSKGFTAGRFQGIADGAIGFGKAGEGRSKNPLYFGDEVDAQGARPLPVINTTFISNALWAGSFGSFNVNEDTKSVWHQDTLIEVNFQDLMGLEANNQRALAVHRQVINKTVTDALGYTEMFDKAFPEIPVQERYNRRTGAFAIAAYFRTILTNKAPFQRWLKGEKEAMTDQQKQGALVFFGKAGCVNCHNSPSLNAFPHRFFALGVNNMFQSKYSVFRTGPTDRRNLGRGGFTYKEEDMHKFKVPQLYNLKDVGFYFHGASKTSLREVVEYFNAGITENLDVPAGQISNLFKPLNLNKQEVDNLVEFLENGLFDPNLERFAPTKTKSGFCFPNNDTQSKLDMGCN
ncbi:cytochrome c peroxidase [Haliscomenobacter sp.]|uniref:cytochrome-c peroxidase n=1 Tax=Haliscomenobacter sp. TaxID=2717303 RepID=UPI003364F192